MGDQNTQKSEPGEATTPDRWFLGLPLVGSRALEEDEKRRLQTEMLEARAKGISFAGVLALTPAMLAVVAVVMPSDPQSAPWEYGIKVLLGLVFVFMLLPVGLLMLRDAIAKFRRLRGDLAQQEVLMFRGKPESLPRGILPLKASKKVVQAAGLGSLDDVTELSCEVLARSERILSINGKVVDDWIQGRIFEATKAQADPYLVSLPREYTLLPTKPGFIFMRRRLADNEIAELERHQLGRREPSSTTIFLGLWLGIMFINAEGGSIWNLLEQPFAWLFFFLVFLHMGSYLMGLVMSSRFGQDLKRAWVVTVHKEEGAELDGGAQRESYLPASAEVEILPESQIVWTREGRPAYWRRAPSRV